jgi:putative transposase
MRAAELLRRDLTGPAPNRSWIADFTEVRAWAAMVDGAFVVAAFAQRILGWQAMVRGFGRAGLVPPPLAGPRSGRPPVVRGELVHHPMPGSPGSPSTSSAKASPLDGEHR